MQAITTIGLDISEVSLSTFTASREGHVILRRRLKRRYILASPRSCHRARSVLNMRFVASLVARIPGASAIPFA